MEKKLNHMWIKHWIQIKGLDPAQYFCRCKGFQLWSMTFSAFPSHDSLKCPLKSCYSGNEISQEKDFRDHSRLLWEAKAEKVLLPTEEPPESRWTTALKKKIIIISHSPRWGLKENILFNCPPFYPHNKLRLRLWDLPKVRQWASIAQVENLRRVS